MRSIDERGMDGAILLPEQHQRHMLALILQMDRRPVRLGDHCRDAGRRWEKQRIHIGVGQRVIKRPGQSGAGGTLQVVANRRAAKPKALRYLSCPDAIGMAVRMKSESPSGSPRNAHRP